MYSTVTVVNNTLLRTSLVVQWLRLHASSARGSGLIPVRGTKLTQKDSADSGMQFITLMGPR